VRGRHSVLVFGMWISSFPRILVKEAVLSPMCIFGTFVEKQMAVAVLAYFLNLYSIPFVYMSVLC
jgi:hypothetical protein